MSANVADYAESFSDDPNDFIDAKLFKHPTAQHHKNMFRFNC
jgi:hypothetical protein